MNGDTVIAETGELLGNNMFAYCFNNPINLDDHDGTWPKWVKNAAKVAVGVVATAAAVALTVSTGGAAAPILIGVASSTALGGAIGYLTGGKKVMVNGAVDGFMWGGIGAFASSAFNAIKVGKYTSGTPQVGGKTGEKLSGIIKNTKSFKMSSGNMRIPDGLSRKLLQEVKNVKSLSLTSQLKDYMQFAKSTGRSMELFIRPNTYMSNPLKQAIAQYGVKIKYLW